MPIILEYLTTSIWGLLIILGIVLAVCLLCYIASKAKYKVHTSGKKIEVLPAEELPKQNTLKKWGLCLASFLSIWLFISYYYYLSMNVTEFL